MDMPKAVWRILVLCRHDNDDVTQHAVRALGSLASFDEAAVLINTLKGIPTILQLCKSTNDAVARYAIAAIGNIAVNEDNKAVVCALRGAETIVERQAASLDRKVWVLPCARAGGDVTPA